jgi:hypothetical protein
MPVSFTIYPDHAFILARFFGQIAFDDFTSSARDYASDASYQAEQNILIDLSDYEGTSCDIVELMHAIAQVFEHLKVGQTDRLIVYLAPTSQAKELAAIMAKSVSAIPGYVVRIADSLRDGFDILGVS